MAALRKIVFVNDYIYHICNRGVDKKPIFTSKWEYDRFYKTLEYYRFSLPPIRLSTYLHKTSFEQQSFRKQLEKTTKLVDILAYCLMPNHFHLLLRQNIDNGIRKYISILTNSYAKYFNAKRQRVSPVFQGQFKAVWIENDELLLHVSRYIHINPVVGSVIDFKDLWIYPWSSLCCYQINNSEDIIEKATLLDLSGGVEKYRLFVNDQVDYKINFHKIEHITLDEV